MTQQPQAGLHDQRALLAFFVLAFGITWGLSLIATEGVLPFAVPPLLSSFSAVFLHYGPAIAALVLVGSSSGRAGVWRFLGRLTHWRVGVGWYLFVFLFPVLLRCAAAGIDVLLGGQPPTFLSADEVPGGNPLVLLPVVFLVVFLQAGLAEELGWRGYALPALQQRYGALAASCVLGVIWGLWHFHPQNVASLWPLVIWYFFDIVAFTVVLTWVYNSTSGSLLMVALLHTASNVADWIVPIFPGVAEVSSIRPFIIQGVLSWAVVVLLVRIDGAAQLCRNCVAQKSVLPIAPESVST